MIKTNILTCIICSALNFNPVGHCLSRNWSIVFHFFQPWPLEPSWWQKLNWHLFPMQCNASGANRLPSCSTLTPLSNAFLFIPHRKTNWKDTAGKDNPQHHHQHQHPPQHPPPHNHPPLNLDRGPVLSSRPHQPQTSETTICRCFPLPSDCKTCQTDSWRRE